MVKKLCALWLLLLLPLTALAAEQRVFDPAQLFSEAEEAQLEERIVQLRQTFEMDFVILADDGARYSSDDGDAETYSLTYANDFYARSGFGTGEEESGFLFFIDMSNRMPTVYTYGAMIDYLDDERLERLLDSVYNDLYRQAYAEAAHRALELAEEYLQAGIPEGNYRYDVLTGQRLTARHKALTSTEIMGAFLVGLAAAAAVISCIKRAYQLKGGAYSYNVEDNSTMDLMDSADDYLNSTVTTVRRPRQTASGGGSGRSGGTRVHSSGGRSFGGGSGRRF